MYWLCLLLVTVDIDLFRGDLALVLQQVEAKLKENHQEVMNLREEITKVIPLKEAPPQSETRESNLVHLVEQSRKRHEELHNIPTAPPTPPRIPVGNGAEAPPPPATAPGTSSSSGVTGTQQLLAGLVQAAHRNTAVGGAPNNLASLQTLMSSLPRAQQVQLQQLVAQQQAHRTAQQQQQQQGQQNQKHDWNNMVTNAAQQLGAQAPAPSQVYYIFFTYTRVNRKP